MIVGEPLPFVQEYVRKLSTHLEQHQAGRGLTGGQQGWLSFCLLCIIVTESVCWRKFVRAGLGQYTEALLSWYFRCPLSWDLLLAMSVRVVLQSLGTWEGVLVLDDTGKKRSKVTKRIPYVHYFKNKQGTGSMRGQEVVFLVLVTPLVTIPVGFAFYHPDPAYTEWAKRDKRLKNQGVVKSKRPPAPAEDSRYPSKQQLGLQLLEQFSHDHPDVEVSAVLADALYGSAAFMAQAALAFDGVQVISQLRANQKVRFRGRLWHISEYFRAYPGVAQSVRIRGAETAELLVGSARLYVEAQRRKCFVIAVRYPEETEYRYLVASQLSWRTLDIVQAYTLRWLVEVFIEDLKVYEGWGQATKQPGVEGSSRGLILSLLCDHCLLLHPEQQAHVARQEPLLTIGSLQRYLQVESFLAWLKTWLEGEDLTDKLDQLGRAIRPLFPLESSKKHMHTRDMGRLEPTPSLKYRALNA